MGVLLEMELRILLKGRLTAARALDLGVGNLALLGQTMSKDDHVLAVKEIEDPAIDVPVASP